MNWDEFVAEWQRPLYTLALRSLGNGADAEDATQEIFVRLYRKRRLFQEDRPLRPWVYQVARNALKNYQRGRGRQRAHDEAARHRGVPTESEPDTAAVDDRERAERLAGELAELSEEDRSLLVLHYCCDVPQVELAEILGIPRSTIQSRMQRTVEAVRERLAVRENLSARERGTAPTTAALSTSFAALAAFAVPARVQAAIRAPRSAAPFWSAPAFFVPALLLVGGAVGAWVGGELATPDSPPIVEESSSAADSARAEARLAEVEEQNRELRETVRRRDEELAGVRGVLAERDAALAARGSVGDAAPSDTDSAATKSEPPTWDRFGELFREYVTLTERTYPPDEDPDATMPEPTEEEMMFAIRATRFFQSCFADTRARSPHPLFDATIAADFVQATYGSALELDLAPTITALVKREWSSFDASVALPIERYHERRRWQDAVHRIVEAQTGGDATNAVAAGRREIARAIVENSFTTTANEKHTLSIPATILADDEDSARTRKRVVGNVLGAWKEAYALTPAQARDAAPFARSLIEAAHGVLDANGIFTADAAGERVEPLPDAIDAALLAAQVRVEREMARRLGPLSPTSAAVRIVFIPGDGLSSGHSSSSPPDPGL